MFQQRIRHGEQGRVPSRCGRIYCHRNEWWFAIRRGPDQGPYPSQDAAKQSLIAFLNDELTFEKNLRTEYSAQDRDDSIAGDEG